MNIGNFPQFSAGFGQGSIPNPDDYAQKYADAHGLSLDDAKAQLRASHGDPQKPSDSGVQGNGAGFPFGDNGLPSPGMDPDEFAQMYADSHNMTVDEAKKELESKHGVPQQPQHQLNIMA